MRRWWHIMWCKYHKAIIDSLVYGDKDYYKRYDRNRKKLEKHYKKWNEIDLMKGV